MLGSILGRPIYGSAHIKYPNYDSLESCSPFTVLWEMTTTPRIKPIRSPKLQVIHKQDGFNMAAESEKSLGSRLKAEVRCW